MGKSQSGSIHIPDELWKMLEAAASAQGSTPADILIDIAEKAFRDHPLRAYMRDGVR